MNEQDQFPAIQFFPSPVFLLKNDRTLVTMNQFAIELIEAIEKTNPENYYDFDPSLSFMAQELDRFFQAKQVENLVTIQVKTNSGIRYFQVTMRKKVGYVAGPNYMLIVFTEISTAKKTESLLEEYHRMVDTLLANLPGMAYRCKGVEDWSLEFVSNGCYSLTGYYPEDLIQNQVVAYNHLIVPEDRKSIIDKVHDALLRKAPFEITYRIIDREGNMKWVWEKGVGIFDAEQNFLAIEGFITDISESKKSEEMKNEFVNNDSNELRASLSSLKESLSKLEIIPEDDIDTRKNTVEIANRNVHRLQQLINGMLDFQPIDSDRSGQSNSG